MAHFTATGNFVLDKKDAYECKWIENYILSIRGKDKLKARRLLRRLDKETGRSRPRSKSFKSMSCFYNESFGLKEKIDFVTYDAGKMFSDMEDAFLQEDEKKERVVFIYSVTAWVPYFPDRKGAKIAFNWWGDMAPVYTEQEEKDWLTM